MTKTALVFPGQGSQKMGMLGEFFDEFKEIKDTFSAASDILGYDLWALAQNGPESEMNLTEKTQPLLLTSSVALWRVWQRKGGVKPVALAGHSLGEWSALVCAGVVEFSDAVELVRARGAFMQDAVPVGQGSMAAIIGLEDAEIDRICKETSDSELQVSAVNYNSPGQVVIAGHVSAVDQAMAACKEAGAKRALSLPVSAPFHTELMRPAAEQLEPLINSTQFKTPEIPVIHNVTAKSCKDPKAIKALMIEQIYKPVRWVECVQALEALAISDVIECGPGKVLSGLVKRISQNISASSTDTLVAFNHALELNTAH